MSQRFNLKLFSTPAALYCHTKRRVRFYLFYECFLKDLGRALLGVKSTISLKKKKGRINRLNPLLANTVWVLETDARLINSREQPELAEISYPAPSFSLEVLRSSAPLKTEPKTLPPSARRRGEEPSGCPGLPGETLNGADSRVEEGNGVMRAEEPGQPGNL